MKKSVMQRKDVPFIVTHQMRFYFPICDDNPYAAYLLVHCYNLRAISIHEYRKKKRMEEVRLMAMSEEGRERELERINDIEVEKYEDRLLNDYSGESFLNDEDDAIEGDDGIFDLDVDEAVCAMGRSYYNSSIDEKTIKAHLQEAYSLLMTKGFLERVWISERLEDGAIEGALEACYPELYERNRDETEAKIKRESKKVQYHLNMAKRVGLPATLTLPEWVETLNHFVWRCACCTRNPYEILEHIQPIIAGGGTTLDNCVPACPSCNTLKRDTDPEFLSLEFDEALENIRRYLYASRQGLRDNDTMRKRVWKSEEKEGTCGSPNHLTPIRCSDPCPVAPTV
jgi:HNH endonuclease